MADIDVNTGKVIQSSATQRVLFLDNLRGIAIIMVLGVHALGYCLPLPENQKEIISFIVHAVSVPVFFLVAGYLFAKSTLLPGETNYLEKVRKSAFRLLIPWGLFTAFYTAARYLFEIVGFLEVKQVLGHSFLEVMISAYGSVYAPQMYFLASLFLIRLCDPIFRRFADIKSYFFMLILSLCYYAVYRSSIIFIKPYLMIEGGQEPLLHAIWGIQYYLLGIVLFKTAKIIKLQKLFVPFLLLFVFTLIMRAEMGQFEGVLSQYAYLITLFLFFTVYRDNIRFLGMIGRNTMGLYLIHAPIVLKAVSIIVNKFVLVPLWSYLLVLLGTFFVSISIVIAIQSIPYGSILFGIEYKKSKPVSSHL